MVLLADGWHELPVWPRSCTSVLCAAPTDPRLRFARVIEVLGHRAPVAALLGGQLLMLTNRSACLTSARSITSIDAIAWPAGQSRLCLVAARAMPTYWHAATVHHPPPPTICIGAHRRLNLCAGLSGTR